MPSILKVNYPMLKVDTDFFSLRFQAFLLHIVQIPINLPTRENIPRLCRVVRNSIQEKGQQFKNQITTFTTLWSEYKASWQYRTHMYICIFYKYRTLIIHVIIQVASWLSWIDDRCKTKQGVGEMPTTPCIWTLLAKNWVKHFCVLWTVPFDFPRTNLSAENWT